MSRRHEPPAPSFFWQGLLILLPVAGLVGVGLYSLHQDRRLAETEATERAQQLANSLAQQIWDDLPFLAPGQSDPIAMLPNAETNGWRCAFQVLETGQLLSPPPYASIPSPQPFDLTQLNQNQTQLWLSARASGESGESGETSLDLWRRFIASSPPENFAASAEYALGVDLLRQSNFQEAEKTFSEVSRKYPNAIFESGIPLGPLAAVRHFEAACRSLPRTTPLDETFTSLLCSNIVWHPAILTPQLLDWIPRIEPASSETQKKCNDWQRVWADHELARALFAAAHQVWVGQTAEAEFQRRIDEAKRAVVRETEEKLQLAGENSSHASSDSLTHNLFPESCWIDNGESWLSRRFDFKPPDFVFVCLRESLVRETMSKLLDGPGKISPYFDVRVELAGKTIRALTNAALPIAVTTILSVARTYEHSVSEKKADGSLSLPSRTAVAFSSHARSNPVKVSVYLTNPHSLYAGQRMRSLWFGLLLILASLTAGLGFISSRRAYFRQLRLNDLKTNFVSSVSHELRAPIASVRLMAEGLESGRVQDETKKHDYFKFIVRECRRLSSLIENVLDFSRIEQGRKQYEFEPTDLPGLVCHTVELMAPYARERSVTIESAVNESQLATLDPPPLLDGRALQQALVNLIDNSIKHSLEGSVVTVGLDFFPLREKKSTTEVLPKTRAKNYSPAQWVQIWVQDHGEGIPPEEHERIFERFYRLGSELRRETQGVGIGLSIVRHIAEAHDGCVSVESAVGKGSRFAIELPIAQNQKGEGGNKP